MTGVVLFKGMDQQEIYVANTDVANEWRLEMLRIEEIISREKDNLNIHEYAFMKSNTVIFSGELRRLCEKNGCGMYGTSWACPPAVGSVEECKNRCNYFENAFMFTPLANLKKKYDVAEWGETRLVHESITEKVAQIFRDEFKEMEHRSYPSWNRSKGLFMEKVCMCFSRYTSLRWQQRNCSIPWPYHSGG